MSDIEKRLDALESILMQVSGEVSDLQQKAFGLHTVPKSLYENSRIMPKDTAKRSKWCADWAKMRLQEDAYRLLPILKSELLENWLRDLIISEIGMAQFAEDQRIADK